MQWAEETLDDLMVVQKRSDEVHIERACWVVFWANFGLALLKILVGALGYSRLLIIDGLHSATNAVLITMILLGMRVSHPQTRSEEHPYGLGKAQFVATLVVGLLLAVGASVILALSIKTFFVPMTSEPTGIGLATALISVGGNLLVLRFLKHTGAMHANTELKRMARLQSLNIASSTVVIQSLLLGALLGWFVVERTGSISISLMVVWLSIRILQNSLDGIMDRHTGKEIASKIKAIASSVDEVEKVEWVRTRRVGQNLCIDIRVRANGSYTMRRADQITAQIRERLASKMEGVSYVTVDCYPV